MWKHEFGFAGGGGAKGQKWGGKETGGTAEARQNSTRRPYIEPWSYGAEVESILTAGPLIDWRLS